MQIHNFLFQNYFPNCVGGEQQKFRELELHAQPITQKDFWGSMIGKKLVTVHRVLRDNELCITFTVSALRGISGELMNRCSRLQLQLLISVK